MKKLMKALALALAMCLVLSTAAFAAIDAPVNYEEKTVNITVTGNGAGEQVSLVVVKAEEEIATGNILYVGQDEANAEGAVTFTAKINDDTVTAVDIYSGNAAYASANEGTPVQKRAQVELVEEETVVTITPAEVVIANGEGEAEMGTAIGMTVVLDKTIAKVIWGFTDAAGVRRYTPALEDYAGLSGSVQLAVSVLNGYKVGEELTTPAVANANPSAIFLFSDNTEAFTNVADDDNRLTVEETPAE